MDISNHADAVETIRLADAEITKWKAVKEAAVEKVKAALGDAEEGTIDGHTVVSYAPHVRTDMDTKRLRDEIPQAIWKVYMRSSVVRPFKLVD